MFSILLAAALSPAAFPCAGIFHEEGALAESGVQEVLLEQEAETVRATYNVVYEGDSADFGWVIALPGEALSLEDGDQERLDLIRQVSAPVIGWISAPLEDSSGCAMGCQANSMKGGDSLSMDTASAGGSNSVEVLGEGFTGTYDYTLLAATDAGELVDWLEENGWSAGGAEGELAAYVADGWTFAALKVTPDDAQTADGGRVLPPVAVIYQGELAYPARMALSGSVAEQRTTIYVLGDQRARLVSGWGEQELEELEGSFEDEPEDLFRDALWDIGGDRPNYAVTFSRNYEDSWITRFDTFAAREAHAADPVFALDGGEERVSLYIAMREQGSSSGRRNHRGLLLLLPLAGLGWSLGRRR